MKISGPDDHSPASGRRRSLLTLAGAGLLGAPLAPAWAQFRVEVSGVGAKQIPVAIAPFQGSSPANADVPAIIRADLERSGVFRLIAAQGGALDENSRPDLGPWRERRTDSLLTGSVTKLADGRLVGDMFDGAGFVRGVQRKGLVLQGARDIQVVDADWGRWRSAFHGNDKATFKLYEKLNHLGIAGEGDGKGDAKADAKSDAKSDGKTDAKPEVKAEAKAEERRAMAVALEQEMKARNVEMKAKVIEAEAEVPKAIAEAFRSGQLGVMDYYKMENIKSDTSMRDSIANSDKESKEGGTSKSDKK